MISHLVHSVTSAILEESHSRWELTTRISAKTALLEQRNSVRNVNFVLDVITVDYPLKQLVICVGQDMRLSLQAQGGSPIVLPVKKANIIPIVTIRMTSHVLIVYLVRFLQVRDKKRVRVVGMILLPRSITLQKLHVFKTTCRMSFSDEYMLAPNQYGKY